MAMNGHRYILGLIFTASLCPTPAARAQDNSADAQAHRLTVPVGVPLHLELTKAVPIKRPGVPVQARTVNNVYVFDQVAIPAGTLVSGRVTQVDSLSRKQRALLIANGNFTPIRTAHVDFDSLVLKDGTRRTFKAKVSQGAPRLVHLTSGGDNKKQGRVREVAAEARLEAKNREQEVMKQIKGPGKIARLKHYLKSQLVAKLPYHRQALALGTSFTAELRAPIQFELQAGIAPVGRVGGEIPPGSSVHIRLLTPLSSSIDHKGAMVRAVVSEPLFASDHRLVLPEGAELEGLVTQAVPARRLGRNGQLRFIFRQLEFEQGAPRPVEASLQSVDASTTERLKLDTEGGAHAVTPKTDYIGPIVDVVLAMSSLDGLDHHHHRVDAGNDGRGPDVVGGGIRGAAGFGLVGSLLGIAAHYRPISAGFAFYGAGWSVYSHLLARGTNVAFPRNTLMEIRFGTHGSSPVSKPSPVSQVVNPVDP